MTTEIQFTTESIVDEFYDYIDELDKIHCVDDIMELLHETLIPMGLDRDFNVYNILMYYDIDDLEDLDDIFNAPYHDDTAVDLKIETIDRCIHLLLMKEDFHREDEDTTYSDDPLIDMDTDEFADDEE
ncbi:hypothetical protein M9Y10_010416 [Tritrichomonas musculus]|uniref:Uncharacterized protein n=1 Tax=Tritrichomonas musculus TaxID=1915356 RepID=A0ABR2IN16_9EUKA